MTGINNPGLVTKKNTSGGPNDRKDNDPRRNGPPLSDKQKLALLRQSGYRLDKGWGPLGERAWSNYLLAKKKNLDTNQAGSYWTNHQKRYRTTAGAGTGSAPADTTTTMAPGTGQPMDALGEQFETLLSQAMGQLLQPGQYAINASNMEYDGSISALARQLQQNKLDSASHVNDINSWYNQADATRAAGAKANIATANQAGHAMDASNAALMSALGGSEAAGMAGAWGQTMAAGLAGDAQAQKGFDNSFAGIMAAHEAQAKQNETNRMSQLAAEMQASRQGLIREKGQSRAKYLAEGQNQRFQQLAAVQNMMLGANQMGLDYDLKNAQLAGQKGDNELNQLQIEHARDVMAESGQTDPTTLPLDVRMELINALKGSVTSRNKQGAPMAKPQTLYTRFANEMGLDTQNPNHRKFLLQVLRSLYPNAQRYPFNFAK
jgi:hypothetical protein